MIEVVDDTALAHDEVKLGRNELRLYLIDMRYSQGLVGYKQYYYDLTQIDSVQLLYEYPDIQRRQKEAVSRTRKKRSKNALAAGALEAAADYGIDSDDSVVDGAIAGPAIGAGLSDVEIIDLIEQSHHFLNLFFRDGTACSIRVDAKDAASILAVLHQVKVQYHDVAPSQSLRTTSLSDEQKQHAEKAALDIYKSDENKVSFILAGIASVVSWFTLTAFFLHFAMFFGEIRLSNISAISFFSLDRLNPYLCVILFCLTIYIVSRIRLKIEHRRIEDGIRQGCGKVRTVS